MNIPLPVLAASALLLVAIAAFFVGRRTAVEGAKPWWASRTVLFNALAAMAAVLEANFQVLKGFLGPEAYLLASILFAGVNVYLRFGTTQPVK